MGLTIIRPNGSRLTLDAVTREDYRPEAIVTDHPVEDGAVVSDHAQRLPMLLTVEGLITESPYDDRVALGGQDVLVATGVSRVLQALDFLRACHGEALTVISVRLGSFSSMALLRFPHSIDRVRRLPLNLEFKQIRIAVAQAVQIPPTVTPIAGAPDEQDAGEQGTTVDVGPNRDRDRSLLLRGLQSLGLAG